MASEGPATDRRNEDVIDPSKNVLDLVDAANLRQDDLRKAETERSREIQKQESRHLRELMTLQATHAKELRDAESARIDAIRTVDIGNVQRAAEVQETRALSLAAQVALSAETLRTQVQTADSAARVNLTTALEPIQKDVADLRRVQYEAQGKGTQVQEARLVTQETRAHSGDSRSNLLAVVAVVSVLIAGLSLVTLLFTIFR